MEKFHENKINILTNLGLSQKEALIYLSALKSGGGYITDLAQSANIERTGVYYHIEKLLDLQLLSMSTRGKRSFFTACDPLQLEKMLDRKHRELSHILPNMHEQYLRQTSQSITEFFQGKREISKFYDRFYEILIDLQTKDDNTLYSLGHSYSAVVSNNKMLAHYEKPEKQLNIKIKTILPASQKSIDPADNVGDPYIVTRYNLCPAELKYVKDKDVYPSPIMIAGDYIASVDYYNLIFSITENKNLAITWRFFFEHLWKSIK